jgi:4-amino-4-deoxy-L-arabinose transferase-like glycosyltransferase
MRDDGVRRTACLAALAAFIVACTLIAARSDLWAPYEPDLVETAREMHVRGDWIQPRLNGMLYLEKPPLFYWAVLTVSWLAGGLTEFAARVPSILSAIVALVALDRFARKLFPPQAAWSAAAIFATTAVFFNSSFRGMTDALLGAATLVALLLFHDDIWGRRHAAPLRTAGAWTVLALAFLAKGPVAVVAVGLTIGPELYFSGRLRTWAGQWRRQVPGLLCFVLIVTPWYAFGASQFGLPFLEEALWRQNGGRFHDDGDGGGPFFMAWNLPIQMGVWGLLLPGIVWIAWKSAAWRRTGAFDAVRFLATGALLELVFLSLCGAKLPKYVLILMPHLAILAAEVVRRLGRGTAPAAMFGAGVALAVIPGLLVVVGTAALASPLILDRLGDAGRGIDPLGIQLAGLVLVVGGVRAWLSAVHRDWQALVPAVALPLTLTTAVFAATPTLASINEAKSDRAFAERAAAHLDGRTPLYGCYLSESEPMFLFYARHEYQRLARASDVVARLHREGRVLVLTRPPFLGTLPPDEAANFRVLEQQEDGKRDFQLVEGKLPE